MLLLRRDNRISLSGLLRIYAVRNIIEHFSGHFSQIKCCVSLFENPFGAYILGTILIVLIAETDTEKTYKFTYWWSYAYLHILLSPAIFMDTNGIHKKTDL